MAEEHRSRLLLLDAAARRNAQLEFQRPVVVVAGAGTGKTSILVARIVAWCLRSGWELAASELGLGEAGDEEVAARVLEGVVAITFTEAAAAEMAERVALAFAALAQDQEPLGIAADALPAPEPRRQRAIALLAAVHRLHAQTIHSFCQWLLRSYPVEAGVDPSFQVDAEGLRLEELIFQLVDEAIRRAFSENRRDPDWIELVGAGVAPGQVAQALTELVQHGVSPDDLARDPFSPEARQELAEELRRALTRFWQAEKGRLARVTRGKLAGETIAALETVDRRIDEVTADADAIRELAASIPERALRRLGDWGKGKLTRSEAAALQGAAGAVAMAAARLEQTLRGMRQLRPAELAVARRIVQPLLAQVYEEMSRRGLVTYSGLLTGARDLLAGSPMLCAHLRRNIRQLLVDELQDTDRLQCDIVRLLALEGDERQRPGLFLVGDPKQSIYGWRNADLQAYQALVDGVEAADGLVCLLSVSFRSAPPILDEVQRVIAPMMEAEHGLQPSFEPLLPCTDRANDAGFVVNDRWAPVEHWVSWPTGEEGTPDPAATSAEATELEARALARDLWSLHHEAGEEYLEMAVLLRSGSDLDVYLEALREAGVPYAVGREREYFRRREVVEAAAVVRWLIDPSDRLALLTLLRSDVVGVPDAALLPLWRAGLPGHLATLEATAEAMAEVRQLVFAALAAVPAEAPGCDRLAGWEEGLLLAIEQLAVLRRSLATDPPDLFIERLRTVWLAEATAAARYLGSFRLARLERFFCELERELVEGDGHLAGLARFLRRAVERERESQEPATPEASSDAVQVMTMHGAKGLDFKHVYLMQLHKRQMGDSSQVAEVLAHEGATVAYSLFGWPTPAFLGAAAWARRVESAERVRLLYVAMTRAKDRLVLAGQWPKAPQAVDPERAIRLLDLMAHRGAQQVGALAASATAVLQDETGARWQLPALPDAGHDPASPHLPSIGQPLAIDRILRDTADLARLRREARDRMERPVSAAASAEAHRLFDLEVRAEQQTAQIPDTGGRQVATVVGTAVHRLLETLDLAQPEWLAEQVRQGHAALADQLAAELGGDQLEAAQQRLVEILDHLQGFGEEGCCLQRLRQIAPHVVARELPLLLPPGQGEQAPVGYIAGMADLVYRDPGDRRLVVADYKTDRVSSDEAVAERTRIYAEQGRLYARAVQEALDLAETPPVELWFLAADRIVRVES